MVKPSLLFLYFLVFINTSCERSNNTVQAIANGIKEASDENEFLIRKALPFRWDTLYIFKPYTTVEEINSTLGFNWKGADKAGITYADNFCLLVFTRAKKVYKSVVFHRKYGDFTHVKNKLYTPKTAIFRIEVQPGGLSIGNDWYNIYDSVEN